MNELIRQSNFKQIRTKYGITIVEIADICNLSKSTVSNFERCKGQYTQVNVRSYNGDMILAALSSLIKSKGDTPMSDKKQKHVFKLSSVDSLKFYENLKKYLDENGTSIKEFSEMCGLQTGFFTPWYCKKYPVMTLNSAKKISEATGWSIEQMSKGEFLNVEKKEETKIDEPKFKNYPRAHITPEEPKPRKFGLGPEFHQQRLEEASRDFKLPHNAQDVKYIYDPNKYGHDVYYISYSVPTFYRQEVTKEKFLELVGGKSDV